MRVPPIDLVKWYAIKDLILNHEIPKALEIARNCKHPDAVWFFNLCKEANNVSDFLEILKSLNDRISLFFKGYLDLKIEYVLESANMGYIHAIYRVIDDHDIKSVEDCALKGERDACYVLGGVYDKNKCDNVIYAASLGHDVAIYGTVHTFGMWPELQYIIGRALVMTRDEKNTYVSFYLSQNESCRKAVDTWSLISTRLQIYKDLRIFIAKMIWETRFEALY